MNRTSITEATSMQRVPRASGDEPRMLQMRARAFACSPRQRG